MSDNVKKPKPSILLYLLLAVTVLVLLCAATIAFLVLGGRTPEPIPVGNATSSSLFLVPNATQSSSTVSTAQTTTQSPDTTRRHRLRPTTPATTRASTTLTAAASTPTVIHCQVIDKCSLVVAERVTCPKTRDDVLAVSPSALSPLHYALNLSVQTVQPTITLDVDSKLRNVEDIRVVNCDTGASLCVAKTVFDQREQRLSLILFEERPSDCSTMEPKRTDHGGNIDVSGSAKRLSSQV
ncbi:hypothetical protein OSTOST_10962 [Ostertagia ostertagi]